MTSILDEGSRLVQDRQLYRAIDVFTEAIELDPLWAEAWNKRATVFYMVGEFQKSHGIFEILQPYKIQSLFYSKLRPTMDLIQLLL